MPNSSGRPFPVLYGDSADYLALADNIIKFVTPLREKRKAIATDPAKVKAILAEGGEKARARAVAKMKDVKEKTGLSF